MPYTWGAAISDAATVLTSFGSTASAYLFTGWFYPTTLTAGRYYTSLGSNAATANYGIRVGTTTSTLQMASATGTPGLWTATADTILFPSGITTNNWWFIAVACSITTTPAVAYRAWLGTVDIPPAPMTVVNNTAPAGLNGSGNIIIGNTTGVAAAFQGDIATITYWQNNTSTVTTPLGIATGGTITNDEATFLENTFLFPIWTGRTPAFQPREIATIGWIVSDLRSSVVSTAWGATTVARTTVVPTGATEAQTDQPRWLDPTSSVIYPPVRR